jgi:hypothetical protein
LDTPGSELGKAVYPLSHWDEAIICFLAELKIGLALRTIPLV